MSVKYKIFLIVLVQLFFLMFFVVSLLTEKYAQKNELQKLKVGIELSTKMSKLIHEIQKERGYTATYLANKNEKIKNELDKQRELTSKELNELKKFINIYKVNDNIESINEKLKEILKDLDSLTLTRTNINKNLIDLKKALQYYTSLNNNLIDIIFDISKLSDFAIITQKMNSYVNFLLTKEKTGIERALGANTLSSNKFVDGIKNKFISIIAQQDSYIKNFYSYATKNQLEFYKKSLNIKEVEEVEKIRTLLANGNEKQLDLQIDATYWFNQISKKINALKKVDDFIADDIINNIDEISSNANNLFIIFLIISIIGTLSIIILCFKVSANIIKNIQIFQNGLLGFFDFLNKNTNDVKDIQLNSNDEFGKMSKIINENIYKTKLLIEEDNQLIQNVKDIVENIKLGNLNNRINKSTQNTTLEELKVIFNQMLEILSQKISNDLTIIEEALDKFSKLDFTFRINNAQGNTAVGLNRLADIINMMLKENKIKGITLNKSADLLLGNVDTLNKNSFEAAASLEETAAALAQITANIKDNTQNVISMSAFASHLQDSSREGKQLASHTASSMDSINEKVSLINDAILVIDQIAFQTNILSLNAAVEAATAGEAGKGFAVVAGEVRNLASRSAIAAKEIKTLVEDANEKANNGKNIANDMIKGYEILNENIHKTLELIKNIEDASKEQTMGIEQINDAITSLDCQTQENVQAANSTQDVALETSNIAKKIIEDVDKKEFIGKNDIK